MNKGKTEISREASAFSAQDPEDYREVEEEYWEEEGSRRSRRSLLLLGLLCVVFGALLWTVLSLTKPQVERSQFVGERIRLPIKVFEKEEPTIPGDIGEKPIEGKPSEVGYAGEEKLSKPVSAEPLEVPPEKSSGQAVAVVEGEEPLGEKKEVTYGEREGEGFTMRGEEERPQIARLETAKGEAKLEGKLPKGRYTVHTASFREEARAERLTEELEEKGYEAFIEKADIPQKGIWYRVLVGRFSSREEAQTFAQELRERGFSYTSVREVKR